MTQDSAASYYMPYYSGPVTDGNGNPTVGFTRYQLAMFNRTGKEPGTDATYNVQQTELALSTANKAETDAQSALNAAAAAQGTASSALAQATQAETDAEEALSVASQAELDAQSALKVAEDMLIMTLLTSSAQVAKTAQSLDDAAFMAAQSQIWPSLLLQSSQAST
ncbi:hypothetical protein HKD27_05800 [Gluconobacter sp. R75690]|uniref:hypothetical protein n=1 Tax=Gluconobacter TaxID=441 RepID=UPI00188B48AD|nr:MULTISPECIES: hypothetical protein [unclassified Gluconobacter]MBF0850438.1 hypothetical protein [Gluconobacter sp. R75690]MBF0879130.1 hypothetical protein [Gluconobacter sp. R75828]